MSAVRAIATFAMIENTEHADIVRVGDWSIRVEIVAADENPKLRCPRVGHGYVAEEGFGPCARSGLLQRRREVHDLDPRADWVTVGHGDEGLLGHLDGHDKRVGGRRGLGGIYGNGGDALRRRSSQSGRGEERSQLVLKSEKMRLRRRRESRDKRFQSVRIAERLGNIEIRDLWRPERSINVEKIVFEGHIGPKPVFGILKLQVPNGPDAVKIAVMHEEDRVAW